VAHYVKDHYTIVVPPHVRAIQPGQLFRQENTVLPAPEMVIYGMVNAPLWAQALSICAQQAESEQ
jgi:hypothetical protein